jgi:hypothetical protein
MEALNRLHFIIICFALWKFFHLNVKRVRNTVNDLLKYKGYRLHEMCSCLFMNPPDVSPTFRRLPRTSSAYRFCYFSVCFDNKFVILYCWYFLISLIFLSISFLSYLCISLVIHSCSTQERHFCCLRSLSLYFSNQAFLVILRILTFICF